MQKNKTVLPPGHPLVEKKFLEYKDLDERPLMRNRNKLVKDERRWDFQEMNI